jgi:hypothetical protein
MHARVMVLGSEWVVSGGGTCDYGVEFLASSVCVRVCVCACVCVCVRVVCLCVYACVSEGPFV